MRAVRLVETGHGPGGLRFADLPIPQPGPDELLVQVHAVSASKLELEQTMAGIGLGRAARLPRVLGMDPAGVVVAQGGDVATDRVGSRVAVKPNLVCGRCAYCRTGAEADCVAQQVLGVHRDGGLAEYVIVPQRQAFPIADDLDAITAAGGVHTVAVARHMLAATGRPATGDTVLVLGASGAVGSALVQLAIRAGARVVAVGSSAQRIRAALPGTDGVSVVECGTPAELAAAVGEPAPAAVLDTTGSAALFSAAIDVLAWRGVAVTCASQPGERLSIDQGALYRGRRSVVGVGASDFADVRAALADLAAGRVRLNVAATYGLSQARAAYEALADRRTSGKVVVTVER